MCFGFKGLSKEETQRFDVYTFIVKILNDARVKEVHQLKI
jgi:hypothetical protein